MRNALWILISLLAFSLHSTYGQILTNLKTSSITIKKIKDNDLLVPLELEFINPTDTEIKSSISVEIDNSTAPAIFQLEKRDIQEISIINSPQDINFDKFEVIKPTRPFYLLIKKAASVNYDRIIYLRVKVKVKDETNVLTTIKVNIQPEERIFTLKEYLEDVNRLDYVTKVESNDNILTVSGYREEKGNDVFLKRKVELERRKVLAIIEKTWALQLNHWKPIPISLTTIPFKVRSKTTSNGKEFMNSATSGLNNIGFNVDLAKYQFDRYFATGKKSTHKFSLGFWLAPSIEELDSLYTFGANGLLGKDKGKFEKTKQLFMSTGLTISYAYNDISFIFVPAGWDFATSTVGRSWIYDKKRWWGFGIALSPKIFATTLNK